MFKIITCACKILLMFKIITCACKILLMFKIIMKLSNLVIKIPLSKVPLLNIVLI